MDQPPRTERGDQMAMMPSENSCTVLIQDDVMEKQVSLWAGALGQPFGSLVSATQER